MEDVLINLDFASVCVSRNNDSPFWNYSIPSKSLQKPEIEIVEKEMKKYNREPAFYFEKSKETEVLEKCLKESNYACSWKESWFFYTKKVESQNNFQLIKTVESDEDFAVFLDTLDQSYQDNDPQNPYGSTGKEYLESTKRSWDQHSCGDLIKHFILFADDKPVACCSLTSLNNLGYISNLGTIKKYRGRGYGKALSLFSVYNSQ